MAVLILKDSERSDENKKETFNKTQEKDKLKAIINMIKRNYQ